MKEGMIEGMKEGGKELLKKWRKEGMIEGRNEMRNDWRKEASKQGRNDGGIVEIRTGTGAEDMNKKRMKERKWRENIDAH